jgi:pimeloyl-ACP methyl ester carboxylesterase
MVGTNNTEILKNLDIPTLVTVGAHDILLPPDMSRGVHALVRNSEFVLVEQGAHFMPFQVPEQFAALVSDFIDRRVKL